MGFPKAIFLKHLRAPGDTIALTAFLRDLKLAAPEIEISLNVTARELLTHHPGLSSRPANDPGNMVVRLDYINDANAAKLGAQITYLESFHRDFFRQTGLRVPLTCPRPQLWLSPEEQRNRPIPGRYWVVCAGGKTDIATKIWSPSSYQAVIDQTPGIRWVQVGSTAKGDRISHVQPRLAGTVNLLDQTTLRQLMQLVYHADGVLCGATQLLLMAQAFERPCVTIIGGRESYCWLAYTRDNAVWGPLVDQINVPHVVFSSQGKLDCCLKSGCWASQVLPPHHSSPFPAGYLCQKPEKDPTGIPIPACLRMIDPHAVATAVLRQMQQR